MWFSIVGLGSGSKNLAPEQVPRTVMICYSQPPPPFSLCFMGMSSLTFRTLLDLISPEKRFIHPPPPTTFGTFWMGLVYINCKGGPKGSTYVIDSILRSAKYFKNIGDGPIKSGYSTHQKENKGNNKNYGETNNLLKEGLTMFQH